MKVADVIGSRTDVFSITDEATVHDAALYLREKGVRAVGIRDKSGKLVGVVSQSDISDKVAAENKPPAWIKVTEIMSRDLITASPETSIEDCRVLMDKHGIFHLMVIDEKGEYRGMISVTDLLKVMIADQKARADMLESYIYPQR
jgi:CBS domain-containing protein